MFSPGFGTKVFAVVRFFVRVLVFCNSTGFCKCYFSIEPDLTPKKSEKIIKTDSDLAYPLMLLRGNNVIAAILQGMVSEILLIILYRSVYKSAQTDKFKFSNNTLLNIYQTLVQPSASACLTLSSQLFHYIDSQSTRAETKALATNGCGQLR